MHVPKHSTILSNQSDFLMVGPSMNISIRPNQRRNNGHVKRFSAKLIDCCSQPNIFGVILRIVRMLPLACCQ